MNKEEMIKSIQEQIDFLKGQLDSNAASVEMKLKISMQITHNISEINRIKGTVFLID